MEATTCNITSHHIHYQRVVKGYCNLGFRVELVKKPSKPKPEALSPTPCESGGGRELVEGYKVGSEVVG